LSWRFPNWFGYALVAGGLALVLLHVAVLALSARTPPRLGAGIVGALLAVGWAFLAWVGGETAWRAALPAAVLGTLSARVLLYQAQATAPVALWKLVAGGSCAALFLGGVPALRRALAYRDLKQESAQALEENGLRCEAIAARFEVNRCRDLPSARRTDPDFDEPSPDAGPPADVTFQAESRCASTYYNAEYVLEDPTDGHDPTDSVYWSARAGAFLDELSACVENPESLREMSAVVKQTQRLGNDLDLADKQVGFHVTVEPRLERGAKLTVFNGANE
jgi:hypothetical protein